MSRHLDKPIIYCISEGLADDGNFTQAKREIVRRISNAGRCGVNLFQIREKGLSAARLYELSSAAAEAGREVNVKLLVNGRADVALAAGAHGVHLPSDGLPAAELRSRVPNEFLIGVSVHSAEEALAARENGADFVTLGPVFQSPGKGPALGLEKLAAVCERLGPFPVLALGGVDESRVKDVLEHGAAGFAAIRYLNECLASGKDVRV